MNKIAGIFLLLLPALALRAQQLTLDEAISIALKNSLDIEVAKNNLEASTISNSLALAGGLPIVNATFNDNQSYTNLNQKLSNGTNIARNGNTNNALNTGVTINYLVYNGNRVKIARSRLGAIEKQSQVLLLLQTQNLLANVMANYYNIVRQNGFINTVQKSIEVTQQRKKLIDARKEVGLANNADTYQAQLDLTASEQDLRNQQLALQQAGADLLRLLTLRADSTVTIQDTIIVDRSLDLETLRAKIFATPAVRSADQQVIINELLEKEIYTSRLPSLSVVGGLNYNRNQNAAGFTLLNQSYGPVAGIGILVPIFNGGIVKKQQQVAAIDIRNAETSREIILRDIEVQITRSWLAYKNNLNQLEVEQQNNKVAADLLNLVQQRFLLGVGTIVDVREAQKSFVEAGFRLVNISFQAKLAEVELKRLSGSMVQ